MVNACRSRGDEGREDTAVLSMSVIKKHGARIYHDLSYRSTTIRLAP